MLKRISVRSLRLGMHIHEFCGSWMEHPFWRTSFLLSSEKDLTQILDSSITELWIDVAKGLDVAESESSVKTREQLDDEVERQFEEAEESVRAPMEAELRQAAKVCAQSKQAVVSMFQELRMGKAIEAERAVPLVEDIASSIARNPGALISLARLKNVDDYTYMHSVAVCGLMIALARQLNFNESDTHLAGLGGLLHDVGKMAIPNEVLNKPGKLTDQEFALMKTHPAEGHRMLLEGRAVPEAAIEVCLHHHEKMDGSGYPERLKVENVSLFARMGAVCDVYDAVTSDRPYKSGWDPAEALRRMAEWSKGHFDERVFQAFVRAVGIYPVGSLVRLASGRLGVIVEQNEKSLVTPKVKVFYSTKSNVRIAPQLIDLRHAEQGEKIVGREDPEKWDFPDLVSLWLDPGLKAAVSS